MSDDTYSLPGANPPQVVQGRFTEKDCENDFERPLQTYLSSGAAVNLGTMLILEFPSERSPPPVISPNDDRYRGAECVVTHMTAMDTRIRGCYVLVATHKAATREWVAATEAETSSTILVTLDDFLGVLDDIRGGRVDLGRQIRDHNTRRVVGLRTHLKINQFPACETNALVPVTTKTSNRRNIMFGFINVAEPGSATIIQTTPLALTAVIYHHRGSPKIWIVVPFTEKTRFEQRLRSEWGEDVSDQKCTEFIKHLSVWISPHLLDNWGVRYVKVLQTEGQILFVFPQAYYWGFSSGFGIAETKYIRQAGWLRDEFQSCLLAEPRCRQVYQADHVVDRSELSQYEIDTINFAKRRVVHRETRDSSHDEEPPSQDGRMAATIQHNEELLKQVQILEEKVRQQDNFIAGVFAASNPLGNTTWKDVAVGAMHKVGLLKKRIDDLEEEEKAEASLDTVAATYRFARPDENSDNNLPTSPIEDTDQLGADQAVDPMETDESEYKSEDDLE